jgi:hypothetical protein
MIIQEEYLHEEERKLLEYLRNLADYRRLAAEFAQAKKDGQPLDEAALHEARQKVRASEPDWRSTAIINGEAVRRYNVTPRWLNYLAHQGKVRAERRGKFWYFSVSDLEEHFRK